MSSKSVEFKGLKSLGAIFKSFRDNKVALKTGLELLKKKHSNIVYHINDEHKIGILNIYNRNVKSPNNIIRETNGVVFNTTNWMIMAHPPPHVFRENFKGLRENMVNDDYEIRALSDGTMITLYYDDEWVLASNNGYNVANYKWMCDKTFKQCFIEVCGNYQEFVDKLPKEYSHTFIMTHPDMHPCAPFMDLQYITSCDLEKINSENVFINQALLLCELDVSKQEEIKVQSFNELKALCHKNTSALSDFLQYKSYNYGFALISKSGKLTNFMFESNLMNTIRKSMYDTKKYIFNLKGENIFYAGAINNKLNNYKKLGNNTNMHLYSNRNAKVCQIYECLDLLLSKITSIIVNRLLQKDTEAEIYLLGPVDIKPVVDCVYNNVIKLVYNNKSTETVLKCIITDLIHDNMYVEQYVLTCIEYINS